MLIEFVMFLQFVLINKHKYLNTPFLVPGIKSNVKKKSLRFSTSLIYVFDRYTKFEIIFFNLSLFPGTINGVLR